MCAVLCLAWVMQVFVNQGIRASKKFVKLQSVKEPVLVLDSWKG